ncbi:MAG: PD-(D/E)XK nuclease family protein [Deltaproteobacteria bacterium]|nr:PD-(D/E)XK nuclease family protein [Deltaproteobacteria bacterium]
MATKERKPRSAAAGEPGRILVAARARDRVDAACAWLAAHPRDAEVLVVAASAEAVDDLVRADVRVGGARFGLARTTLGRVAGLLAAPALAARGGVPASVLSLDAVAARAIHQLSAAGRLRYFAPVADRPGFPLAVARTMAELRAHGVTPAMLAALPLVGEDLALLAAEMAAELDAAGLADRTAVFAAATAAVEASPAPPLVGLPTLLLDVALASACEADLVAALARRAPALLATVPLGDDRSRDLLAGALATGPTIAEVHDDEATSLARLQRHLFAPSTPPPAPLDETVTLLSWPGEARECVEIARRIQEEAARGVPFDRMAVFLHAPREYTAHLEEAFRRADVPAFFARGTSQPDPAGRALLALLACAAEGLSARRFAEYLSLAQVPDPEARAAGAAAPPPPVLVSAEEALLPAAVAEQLAAVGAALRADAEREGPLPLDPLAEAVVAGTVAAPWRWEELLVEAAVIGGKERWRKRLDGLARELDVRRAELAEEDEPRAARLAGVLAQLGHLRAYALPLIERLDGLAGRRATWGAWLDELRALAVEALRDPTQVLATLAELAPMAPVGPVAIDEVRIVLGPRLRSLTVPPPRRRHGAVFVAPAESARGLVFDVVFVPGLAERLFPRKIVDDPILLDPSRRALADVAAAPLGTRADRVTAERLALRLAVGAAGARVVVSYPRLDMEQGKPRVPSFYALEALRAAEGRLPGFEELRRRARGEGRLGWPAPERPEDAIDDAEYDLALLAPLLDAQIDPKATVGTARYLLGANAHLARALRARAQRWWKRWTPADGLVDPDDLGRTALAAHQLAARSYSPTALQHFAACPYRFFLQAVHRLKPREEPVAIELIDPLTRGSLFHEVQFGVLSRLKADGLLPVRAETLLRARDVVDGVLDGVAERYRELLCPAIPRVWEDGVNGIRADLREWLRRSAEDEAGWVPDRFELAFGLPRRERGDADPASVPQPITVAGPLQLRGSIDLVERHPRGALRVTDHKTGKARAANGVVVGGGEVLQPLLYALACERLLPEPVEAGRLYYCTAAGGYAQRVVPLDAAGRAAAAAVVDTIDQALRDGFLPAAPVARACAYCDYRPVCGPYEEIRQRRKPAERLRDLARLRSLP